MVRAEHVVKLTKWEHLLVIYYDFMTLHGNLVMYHHSNCSKYIPDMTYNYFLGNKMFFHCLEFQTAKILSA